MLDRLMENNPRLFAAGGRVLQRDLVPGAELRQGAGEHLGGEVGVALRGRDGRVPEDALDLADIGAVPEEPRCDRVADRVRGQVTLNPSAAAVTVEEALDRVNGDALARSVDEQKRGLYRGFLPRIEVGR